MKFTNAIMTLFTFFFAPLFMAAMFVSAAPLNAELFSKKDVFVPTILEPTASTVWKTGEVRNITWDTSNAPAQITNRLGLVLLRFGDITAPLILAKGFDILDGTVSVTVPRVEKRTDWSIVLFGDSGNFSPQFEIDGEPLFGQQVPQ
ncbi:hypothetical protein BXZ70DRAFT_942748 [Cristinia sonorae]|uniref:Yeast cell wall synthesis Kre9/Knh1-like N-terminal domain-containing protein n=1 Tax=Cristinia sonorae TaxID=1940300 RepID=A0A8K0ULC8_9AGAR|nr:hypothetical protein BXZ70DRAFT_942748 [Cristinia sonorae]